mmetsp:Transcript_24137/g.53420  ORF Transcript_24137/g.53420 Transcript_24137/m.53420 type:complete len:225 (+) Transcript_24137:777-1451(+)
MSDAPGLDSLAKFPTTSSSDPKYTITSAATTRSNPSLSFSVRELLLLKPGASKVSSNVIASRSSATKASYNFSSLPSVDRASSSSSIPHPVLSVHLAAFSNILCDISTPIIGPVTRGRKNLPASPVPQPASRADANGFSSPRALAATAPMMPGTRYSILASHRTWMQSHQTARQQTLGWHAYALPRRLRPRHLERQACEKPARWWRPISPPNGGHSEQPRYTIS